MNNDTPCDPLDELLSKQPIRPSRDFTASTLARIKNAGGELLTEVELDHELDAWLATHEATPSEGFSKRVVQEATAQKQHERNTERKVLGFPVWAATLTGLAAALVAGVFAFHMLFEYSYDQSSKKNAFAAAAQTAPDVQVIAVVDNAPKAVEAVNESTLDQILARSPNAVPDLMDILMLSEGSSQAETDVADLILFEESLLEVAALSDTQTLNALTMLVN